MKFWEIKNSLNSSEEAELILYGDIMDSQPWWRDGNIITPDNFLEDMKILKAKNRVTVRLNSPGGDVFAAQAIYTQLKSLTANKTIIIDGLAASAATIIAMAGDTIKIPSNALFMIHNPSITVWDSFEAADLEELKNMLDVVKDSIIEAYCQKTNKTKDELSKMMDNTTWLTGKQAVEQGFADELLFEDKTIKNSLNGRFLVTNSVTHDLSRFKNVPTVEVTEVINKVDNSIKNIGGRKMNLEEFKAQYPELFNQITNIAKEEGAKAERQRIEDIEKISNTLPEELVKNAKFIECIDAKDLAFKALQDNAKKGTQFIKNLQADAEDAGVENVEIDPKDNDSEEEQAKNKINMLSAAINLDKRRVK